MQAQCEEKDEWSDWEKRHRWIRAGLALSCEGNSERQRE